MFSLLLNKPDSVYGKKKPSSYHYCHSIAPMDMIRLVPLSEGHKARQLLPGVPTPFSASDVYRKALDPRTTSMLEEGENRIHRITSVHLPLKSGPETFPDIH